MGVKDRLVDSFCGQHAEAVEPVAIACFVLEGPCQEAIEGHIMAHGEVYAADEGLGDVGAV